MKTKEYRTVIILSATALLALLFASCGTVRGFGRDVEHAGGHIEQAGRQ